MKIVTTAYGETTVYYIALLPQMIREMYVCRYSTHKVLRFFRP